MNARELIRLKAPKWYIVLLRVFMGCFYLRVAADRLLAVHRDAGLLKNRMAGYEAARQLPWFEAYLRHVIDYVRDSAFFTPMLLAAPILLGLSLVLGLFTRVGSLVGALLVVHIYLVRFYSASGLELMLLELQFAVLMTLLFSAAGRSFGLDAVFWRHRILATYAGRPDPRWAEPRVPVIKDLPAIPLSEGKPKTSPSSSGQKPRGGGYDLDASEEKKPK